MSLKLSKNVKNAKIEESAEKGVKMDYYKGFQKLMKIGVFSLFFCFSLVFITPY